MTEHGHHSPQRWLPADARLRIVAAFLLAFAGASVQSLALLPMLFVIALIVAHAAGLSARAMLHALRLPGMVVLALVLLLPFAGDGAVLASVGVLQLRADGLTAAALIGSRALAIVLLSVALLGTMPTTRLFAALRGLGVPVVMVDIAMLLQRYLIDIRRELAAMQLAARLRGQRWRLRATTLRTFGWTIGALLLRSHARAEQTWLAMRLRGHGEASEPRLPSPSQGDWLRFMTLLLAALMLTLAGLWR